MLRLISTGKKSKKKLDKHLSANVKMQTKRTKNKTKTDKQILIYLPNDFIEQHKENKIVTLIFDLHVMGLYSVFRPSCHTVTLTLYLSVLQQESMR